MFSVPNILILLFLEVVFKEHRILIIENIFNILSFTGIACIAPKIVFGRFDNSECFSNFSIKTGKHLYGFENNNELNNKPLHG